MSYFVYILRCSDETLYTGCTNQMLRRLAAHQSGKGAKYTRSRLPVELVYQEEVPDRSAALRREAAIKRLTRQEKLLLIQRSGREPLGRDRPMTDCPACKGSGLFCSEDRGGESGD